MEFLVVGIRVLVESVQLGLLLVPPIIIPNLGPERISRKMVWPHLVSSIGEPLLCRIHGVDGSILSCIRVLLMLLLGFQSLSIVFLVFIDVVFWRWEAVIILQLYIAGAISIAVLVGENFALSVLVLKTGRPVLFVLIIINGADRGLLCM